VTAVSTQTRTLLRAVGDERARQDTLWGEQNHPDTTWNLGTDPVYYRGRADWWRKENTYRGQVGKMAWDGILLEEVFEALGEMDRDPAALRAELLQVAAVALAWAEALGRREPLGEAAA
jgi:hypothetical protein